ncbi:hypothetical protein PHMEG_00011361 [Phytophthora megakarya]|uniref:CCT domain-containing protein n=1 Tax=Phytophthora megakarya TaxID=4795 RepID=A0A225WBE9_9STRA|nr:hypothetical protein PHMEG_00011361 [Phytophthora megakarya]
MFLNSKACIVETASLQKTSLGDILDGIAVDVADHRQDKWFGVFITALRTFHSLFGHTAVPEEFVVPQSSLTWPQEAWGLHLGQIISRSHDTKKIYKEQVKNSQQELQKVAPLIATFAYLHPQDTIPWGFGWGFTIPSEEPWPENVWGVDLGFIVQWNLSRLETIERDWKDQVLVANEVYQYENGNKILRDKFVVPHRSPWPYKTWGRELRHILTCVQIGRHYGGRAALANFHANEVCAVLDEESEQWKKTIFPALHLFAMVFGHCSVSEDFVVPSESPWPKQIFKLQLGSIVADIEKNGMYFAEVGLNADRLETFGFRYKLADAPWETHIAPLMKMYASEYPHMILPEDFVVPPKRPWPEERYGLRLGKIISWSARFAWDHDEAEWKEREMPENSILAGGYGYCRVPERFKVPNEHPWPKQMWGLRMKIYLRQLNRRGDLFLPGGRASTGEKSFGFVFKLASEGISCGKPKAKEYRADVKQIGGVNSPKPESYLGKRELNCSRQEGWIGTYSPKSRKERIQRFLLKREKRVWVKEVKYNVRKNFADKRLRVQGRFVPREDEKTIRELLNFT